MEEVFHNELILLLLIHVYFSLQQATSDTRYWTV